MVKSKTGKRKENRGESFITFKERKFGEGDNNPKKFREELKQEGEKNKKSGNQQADITYYYHYDNLKSTTLLTDETGNVVETYDYGTYGEVTSGDTSLTRFLYNGGLGVSSDSNGLYYMRARYYNPTIRRFINQDVEAGSMDDSASLNRYAYVQGNPVSLTDPFGLSPDMEYGNYEANALKRLFKVADKVADYLPVVGTARDIKRSYNAFKNGNIADGIKHGATAALALAVPTAKLATKAAKTTLKLAKNALKAEKCISKTAEIATEGIKLARDIGKASKLAGKAGSVSAGIAKTVKNGVSTVARTVKRNAAKVYKRSSSAGVSLNEVEGAGGQLNYSSIMHALRESNSVEGDTVAKLLKKGKINVKIKDHHFDGRGGSYFSRSRNIIIYRRIKTPDGSWVEQAPNSLAGFLAHETKHWIDGDVTTKMHEFVAYMWQKEVDKVLKYTDEDVWNIINTSSVYKHLGE